MTKVRMTKKLVALATTIMLLVAMLVPVTAAPGAPEGKITVHKYAGNSIAPALPNNTGEELSDIPGGFTGLASAEFTLYQLAKADVDALHNLLSEGIVVTNHAINIVDGVPQVTWTLSNNTTHVTVETVAYGGPKITNGDGKAVFGDEDEDGNGDIPDGYYVLVETKAPMGYQAVSPSLIRLPLTTEDGTHNYDIHVYPKNISTAGAAVKSIDGLEKPLTTGDSVTFDLKARFNSATVSSVADLRKDTPLTYGIAEIQENFATTFEYEIGSLSVHWLDTDGEIIETAISADYYQIMEDTAENGPGGDLVVRLTASGIEAAIAGTVSGFGLRLKAMYVGGPGVNEAVTNTMQASIIAAGANITPPVVETIYVPTINIVVDKRTSGGGALEGVTFGVAKVAVPQINYIPGTSVDAFTSDELEQLAVDYIVDENGLPITGVTNSEGAVTFSNLNGYTDEGIKFYLKELATKPGYQLKSNTIEVVFKTLAEYKLAVENSDWFDEDMNWKANVQIMEGATVVNYLLTEEDPDDAGFSLPLTGGAGTLLFTAVGIVVMLGAAVAYLHGKKKNV